MLLIKRLHRRDAYIFFHSWVVTELCCWYTQIQQLLNHMPVQSKHSSMLAQNRRCKSLSLVGRRRAQGNADSLLSWTMTIMKCSYPTEMSVAVGSTATNVLAQPSLILSKFSKIEYTGCTVPQISTFKTRIHESVLDEQTFYVSFDKRSYLSKGKF
jgi:hypothetical protein